MSEPTLRISIKSRLEIPRKHRRGLKKQIKWALKKLEKSRGKRGGIPSNLILPDKPKSSLEVYKHPEYDFYIPFVIPQERTGHFASIKIEDEALQEDHYYNSEIEIFSNNF